MAGKHFNRCKRLHPLLSTALHVLHFRQFVELHGPVTNEFVELLNTFAVTPTAESLAHVEESEIFIQLMDQYEQFSETTRRGDHGVTAKFWMTYIDLVQLYLLLDHACRITDVDLYMYALQQTCPVFFATQLSKLCKMDDQVPLESFEYGEHT